MKVLSALFDNVAEVISDLSGTPTFFFMSLLMIVIWAGSGKYFNYSDTWQLIINTGTTIVTFLIAIITQYKLNKESADISNKLNDTIKQLKGKK